MKKQSGFTLIELVMVIVILGILAATALPKFVDLGRDARAAAIKAVEGSMRSTNAIIYAKASVNNVTGTTLVPGSLTTAMVPAATAAIATAYSFAVDATDLKKLMDLSSEFTVVAGSVSHSGGATPANCSVTYTAATSASAPPTYLTDVTGC